MVNGAKCPTICPPICNENEVKCPDSVHSNGCPMPGQCVPKGKVLVSSICCTATTSFVSDGCGLSLCPIQCGPGERKCPSGFLDNGCPRPDTCTSTVDNNRTSGVNKTAKTECPPVCPVGAVLCAQGSRPFCAKSSAGGCGGTHPTTLGTSVMNRLLTSEVSPLTSLPATETTQTTSGLTGGELPEGRLLSSAFGASNSSVTSVTQNTTVTFTLSTPSLSSSTTSNPSVTSATSGSETSFPSRSQPSSSVSVNIESTHEQMTSTSGTESSHAVSSDPTSALSSSLPSSNAFASQGMSAETVGASSSAMPSTTSLGGAAVPGNTMSEQSATLNRTSISESLSSTTKMP